MLSCSRKWPLSLRAPKRRVAGGELTWRAGPLVKGSGLCHGTSGNAYAFLVLHRRTGDELWLDRARAEFDRASAYWAFRDMQGRSDNAVAPYLAATFIIAFTPILFPLAVFTYRIVRPHERIGDVYERNLAEEAMLAEMESDDDPRQGIH